MVEPIPTWEYRFELAIPLEKLRELGKDGWELAGVDERSTMKFIFKRPAQSFVERVTLEQRAAYYALLELDPDGNR